MGVAGDEKVFRRTQETDGLVQHLQVSQRTCKRGRTLQTTAILWHAAGISCFCHWSATAGRRHMSRSLAPTSPELQPNIQVKLRKEYAALAVSQLLLMGKEEFLTSRMSALSEVIKKSKPGVVARNTVQSSPAPNNIPRNCPVGRRSRSRSNRRERNQKETSRPSSPSRSWTPRPRSSGRAPRGDPGLRQM